MLEASANIKVGQRVRVIGQIARPSGALVSTVEGVVLRIGQQKTGSWFAHALDKKLWIDRVELRKDDGEIVVRNLDAMTRVEVVE
ncbi:MAG: hypothetical protein KF757_00140 [Phycisphaeraceae bacterium]|nr:hypothetical protein [Phycisphaeraceae bacterium]MCW5761616.1 hypothetical protein [Phycisphaeraceae bacterium]